MNPRPGRSGSIASTLALLTVGFAGSISYALAQPAYSTGDEMAHVDYAYQLWLGQFPVFLDGLKMPETVGIRPDVQWVSQHPPLFYVMLAPIVGPLIQAGDPVAAVMVARVCLAILAALSVLAVRWMVRAAFPTSGRAATIAALLYALSSWFPRQGGSIYNDMLAILAVTLATGFAFRAMRQPKRRIWIVGLAISLAAASLSRFSALPLAGGILIGLAVQRIVVLRSWPRAILEVLGCLATIALASGWWWLRNVHTVGNPQGSQADYWITVHGRRRADFSDVISSGDFWHIMLQQFFSTYFYQLDPDWVQPARWGVVLLFCLPLLVGVITAGLDLWRRRKTTSIGTDLVVWLTLLGIIAVVIATQVYYTMSSGSPLPRYLFALIPAAAALMAFGFANWRFGLALLSGWLLLRFCALAIELESTLNRSLIGPQADSYPRLAWVGYTVVVAGSLVVLWSISRMTEQKCQSELR